MRFCVVFHPPTATKKLVRRRPLMEKEIIRLNPKNFDIILGEFKKIYTSSKTHLLEAIIDCVLYMPHSHHLISDFILQASAESHGLQHDFVSEVQKLGLRDAYEFFSLLAVLNHLESKDFVAKGTTQHLVDSLDLGEFKEFMNFLGIHGGHEVRTDADVGAKPLELRISSDLREDIRSKVRDFGGMKVKYPKMNYDCCIAQQIIRNLGFNMQECALQLTGYFNPGNIAQAVYSILISAGSLATVDFILLVLSLSKEQNFLGEFYPFVDPSEEVQRIVCSFIFEQYYNDVGGQKSYYDMNSAYNPSFCTEEIELFKSVVSEDTIQEMRSYSSRQDLESFFGKQINEDEVEITEEAFQLQDALNEHKDVQMAQREFFHNFCLIGSPSVTHFLVNLENSVRHFDLNEDSQRVFCEVFLEVFGQKKVFREVVCRKMLKFGIIAESVAHEYPALLRNVGSRPQEHR